MIKKRKVLEKIKKNGQGTGQIRRMEFIKWKKKRTNLTDLIHSLGARRKSTMNTKDSITISKSK